MPNPELALVIPVFNEETLIGNVLNTWSNELNNLEIDYEIHVYIAKSKDRTLEIVQEFANNNNKIIAHDRPKLGHGADLVKGYKDNLNAKWIFQVDSDDEIKASSFKKLWEKRNDFDFLIGKRIRINQQLIRKLTSLVSRLSIWTFYGNSVYDVNAPYRLMRSESFKELFTTFPESFLAPNLVVSGYASLKNLRVFQTPVESHDREVGTAGLSKTKLLKTAVNCFFEAITFRFKIK